MPSAQADAWTLSAAVAAAAAVDADLELDCGGNSPAAQVTSFAAVAEDALPCSLQHTRGSHKRLSIDCEAIQFTPHTCEYSDREGDEHTPDHISG